MKLIKVILFVIREWLIEIKKARRKSKWDF
jgi:hypothetical protein